MSREERIFVQKCGPKLFLYLLFGSDSSKLKIEVFWQIIKQKFLFYFVKKLIFMFLMVFNKLESYLEFFF